MIHAQREVEEEEYIMSMNKLAWQTALLMNATGNYKKKIKPTDLFNPDNATEAAERDMDSVDADKIKQEKQEELRKIFKDSFN